MSGDPEAYDIEIQFSSFQDYYGYCRQTEVERPGVLGLAHRGFRWRGRALGVERKMQQLWLDFAREQPFLCF